MEKTKKMVQRACTAVADFVLGPPIHLLPHCTPFCEPTTSQRRRSLDNAPPVAEAQIPCLFQR
jgi:hypothetical protein